MKTISILGMEFEVATPYEEGHTITAAEAKALNQTRTENIANNQRKAIKACKDGGEGAPSEAEVRAAFKDYEAGYVFTLASTGGSRSTMTPLEKEATKVAKAWLTQQLKAAGKTGKQYIDENGKEYVDAKVAEIAASESIQKLAAKNLKEAEKASESVAVSL